MKMLDVCLLKPGDKVYVNNKKGTVTAPAKNDTICVDGKFRYFSELSKVKAKETGYANGIYAKLMVD